MDREIHRFINECTNYNVDEFVKNQDLIKSKLLKKSSELTSDKKYEDAFKILTFLYTLNSLDNEVVVLIEQLADLHLDLLPAAAELVCSSSKLYCNMGMLLKNDDSKINIAISYFNRALGLCNNNDLFKAQILMEIGKCYLNLNLDKIAVLYFQRSKNFFLIPDCLNHLAVIYLKTACFKEALELFSQIEFNGLSNHQKSGLLMNLAFCYDALRDKRKSEEYYNQSLILNPRNHLTLQNKIMSSLYSEYFDPYLILKQSKEINKCFKNSNSKNIGLITGDLHGHPVLFFIRDFIENIDCVVYSNGNPDPTLKPKGRIINIHSMSNENIFKRMKEDCIDVLIDLSGYTNKNKMDLLALKPARKIVSYLGYPSTTGLDEVDYRFALETDNPDHFSEKLVVLNNFFCFNYDHILRTDFCIKEREPGAVVFGCYNKLNKVNLGYLNLIKELLDSVAGSLIVFKTKELSQQSNREWILKYLPEDRVILKGHNSSFKNHIDSFNDIDLMVDTSPYNGTTTTCDSLFCGIPVLTIIGEHHISNVSRHILKKCGLEDYICLNSEDLINKAVKFSKNLPCRKSIHQSFINSDICNREKYIFEMKNVINEL